MDMFDRNPTVEGSSSDPALDWNSPVVETGLEEPMWHLRLGSRDLYPERPGELDCIYYMRTGFCGYGARCRYNHPRDRSTVVVAARAGAGEYPERVGQPVCQYFLKTGTCKFGASCKYHHPRHGSGSVEPASLNYYGYPLRPGEKECSYYVKTGQCKFGVTCKFHHPQPATPSMPVHVPTLHPTVQSPSVPTPQQYGGVAGGWQVMRSPLLPGSYVQGPYGPVLLSSGMVPFPGWSTYPASGSPVASAGPQPTVGAGSLYGTTPLSPSALPYDGIFPSFHSAGPSSISQKENIFPERPGQPECQFYMRTGHCKFGSTCKYHHPPELIMAKTSCILSPMGLPLRPGASTCTFYAQHGVCRYGPTCKFDHPMGILSYSPSTSSLADMPVAPYTMGPSRATLAPSSSSSDLRPEPVFSKTGSFPHSSVHFSGSSSIGHGGEIRTSK